MTPAETPKSDENTVSIHGRSHLSGVSRGVMRADKRVLIHLRTKRSVGLVRQEASIALVDLGMFRINLGEGLSRTRAPEARRKPVTSSDRTKTTARTGDAVIQKPRPFIPYNAIMGEQIHLLSFTRI